jgi:hypothetical protein
MKVGVFPLKLSMAKLDELQLANYYIAYFIDATLFTSANPKCTPIRKKEDDCRY